jgi:hypothetical protein
MKTLAETVELTLFLLYPAIVIYVVIASLL